MIRAVGTFGLTPVCFYYAIFKLTADHYLDISRAIDPSQGTSTWKHSDPQANHFLTALPSPIAHVRHLFI